MRPATILVVDDNKDDVFLLQHALRKAGFINPVQVLETGTDAIQYLDGVAPYNDRTRYPCPGLLLLDLHLPLQTGFDVLAWLRTHPQPELRALVCTGTASPEEIEEAYRLGAGQVVEKTANFRRLIELWEKIPGVKRQTVEQGAELVFS